MVGEFQKLLALISSVKNPTAALADKLRLRRSPYTLRLRNGVSMELRPRAGDLFGFYEILLRMDYLAGGQTIAPGDTVIDVGANIGCFTVLASRMAGPAGRVIAVEPEESTYRQLLRNISLNHLENVIPLRRAVGAKRKTVTLHSGGNKLFSSLFTSVDGHGLSGADQQQVQMTTLDEIMDQYRIPRCDYLKLDCEGAEHEIFGEMSAATAQRLSQITMEVHEIPGHDRHTLKESLARLGFQRMGGSAVPFYARPPLLPKPAYA